MTPEQLKASILQLAIQGKLVPQRPEEGTAEELYQQIKREKKKLISAGKLKKEKPLPPIEESEMPFDIPETWKWVRLGEIVLKLGSGSTPIGGRRVYVNAGIKFIRSQNVYNDGLRISNVAFISEEINNKHLGSQVMPQDVLLNITGASIGRCAVVPDDFDLSNVNQHVMIIRLIDKTLRKWVHLAMISPYIQKLIMNVQVGVSREGLSATKLAHFLIPMPPLAEQQRTVEKIEQMLPLVEQYGEAYTALESLDARFPDDMRKSILQYAIQGKLVPQRPEEGTAEDLYQQIQQEKKKLIAAGKLKKEKPLPPITEDEIPFDIPESWKWVRLRDICSRFSTGPFGSMLHKSDYCTEGTPVINPTNVVHGRIDVSKAERVSDETRARLSSFAIEYGDILLARRGNLSKCAAALQSNVGWLCGTGAFIIHPLIILPDWFCVFYVSVYVQAYLMADSVGTTMNNLNQTLLGKLPIPLPPLAEQQRIVEKAKISRCYS